MQGVDVQGKASRVKQGGAKWKGEGMWACSVFERVSVTQQ